LILISGLNLVCKNREESDMKIDLSFFANSIILFATIIALTVFKVVSCKPFKEEGEEFS
jgi:hypothetical protein